MKTRRIIAWTALIVVTASTIWLLMSSYMLLDLFSLSEARVIVAREGAELALKSDGLYVLKGEAGMVSRSLLPTLALAVLPLAFFAFVGCRSMLRQSLVA